MDWWIIGSLAVVVLILISIYRVSLRENRNLTQYTTLMLLDEGVYRAQRESLLKFIDASAAQGASALGTEILVAMGRLADRVSADPLDVAGLAWKIKTR